MKQTAATPPIKSHVEEQKILRFPDGTVRSYRIVDEIAKFQASNNQKYFCLQKLKYDNGDDEEIRFGYYIIRKKSKTILARSGRAGRVKISLAFRLIG
jgi:hypothetical protein